MRITMFAFFSSGGRNSSEPVPSNRVPADIHPVRLRNEPQHGTMEQSTDFEPTMTKPATSLANTFSDEEISSFAEQGYIVVKNLLDDETRQRFFSRTREDATRLVEPIEYEAELNYPGAPVSLTAPGGKTPRRLKTAHSRDPVFLETIRRPEIASRLRQLLGPEVVMPTAHHNCIMTKEPRFSSDTGWHQDIRYWRFERRELVTVWFAMGREYPENGCLRVIPGTHRELFAVEQLDEELFLREDLDQNREILDRAVDVPLEPGDVLFFHCRTFHSASRNYTDQTKYSAVFTFRSADNPPIEGTRSDSMEEIPI